jgi:ABC-type glycerol-3-phosphate transport system substrate-binding protein
MNKTVFILLFAMLLAACSGGGDSDSAATVVTEPLETGMVWDQGNFNEKNWQ